MRSVGKFYDLARLAEMDREDLKKYYDLLGIQDQSSRGLVKKAFIRKALQHHPDKHPGEPTELFQRLCAAYWKVSSTKPMPSCDKIFFGCFVDVEDAKLLKRQPTELFDSEEQFQDFESIVQSRRSRGKYIPSELTDREIAIFGKSFRDVVKDTVVQQLDRDIVDDSRKAKQKPKPAGAPAVVAKPKPKTKKQLQAEQRRREKEMAQIAAQLEEKAKLDEEKAEQRKQAEAERLKKQEEERIKQLAEMKRKEREAKEKQPQVSSRKREKETASEQLQLKQQPKKRDSKDKEGKRQENKQVSSKKEDFSRAKRKQPSKQVQQDATQRHQSRQTAPRRQQQLQQQQQQLQQAQQLNSRSQYEVPPRFRQRQAQQQQMQQPQQQHDGSKHQQSEMKHGDVPQPQNSDEVSHVEDVDLVASVKQWTGPTSNGGVKMNTIETLDSEIGECMKEEQFDDSDRRDESLSGSANTLDLLSSGLTELREPMCPISDTASLLTSSNWASRPSSQTGSLATGISSAWSVNGSTSWDPSLVATSHTDLEACSVSAVSSQTAWEAQHKPNARETSELGSVWNKAEGRRKVAVGTSGSEGKSEQPRTEAAMLGHLLDMGFEEGQALKALRNNPSNFEGALGDLLALAAVEEQSAVEQESLPSPAHASGPTVDAVHKETESNQTAVDEQEPPPLRAPTSCVPEQSLSVEQSLSIETSLSFSPDKNESTQLVIAEPSSSVPSSGEGTVTSQKQAPPIQPILQQLVLQLQLQQLTPQILASQLMALQQAQEKENKLNSVKDNKQQVTPLIAGAQLLLQQQQQQQQLSWLLSLLQGFQGLSNPLTFPQLQGGSLSFPPQGIPNLLQQLQQTPQVREQVDQKPVESLPSGNTVQMKNKPFSGSFSQTTSTASNSEAFKLGLITTEAIRSESTTSVVMASPITNVGVTNAGPQAAVNKSVDSNADHNQGPRLLKLLMGQSVSESNSNLQQLGSQQNTTTPSFLSPDGWPSFSSSDLLNKGSLTGKNPWGSDGLTSTLSSLGSQSVESEAKLEMQSLGEPPVDIQLDFLTSPDELRVSREEGKTPDSPHWSLTDKTVAHIGPPAFEPGKIWPGLSGDEGDNKKETDTKGETGSEIPALVVKPQTRTTDYQAALPVQTPSQSNVAPTQVPQQPTARKWSSGVDGPLQPKGPLLATPPYPPTVAVHPSSTGRPLAPPFPAGLQTSLPFTLPADFSNVPQKQGILGAHPLPNRPQLSGTFPVAFPGLLPVLPPNGRPTRPPGIPKSHTKSVASVRPVPHMGPHSTHPIVKPGPRVTTVTASIPPVTWANNSTHHSAVSSQKQFNGMLSTSSKPEVRFVSEQQVASSPDSPQLQTSWVLLKNIPKQFDMDTLRSFCQQHGPLKAFEPNSQNGSALVKYSSTNEALRAKSRLHLCPLGGARIDAYLVGETDLALFYEQLPAAPVARSCPVDNNVLSKDVSQTTSLPGTVATDKMGELPSVGSVKRAGVMDFQSSVPLLDAKAPIPLAGQNSKMWSLAGPSALSAVSTTGLNGLWSDPVDMNSSSLNPWMGSLESMPAKIGGSSGSTYTQSLSGSIYGSDST